LCKFPERKTFCTDKNTLSCVIRVSCLYATVDDVLFHTDSRRRRQREVCSRFLNAGARTRCWLAERELRVPRDPGHRCREFGQLLLVRCFRDVVLEIDICLHKTYLAKSAVKIVSSSSKNRERARVEYSWAICCCWRLPSVASCTHLQVAFRRVFDEHNPTMTNLARCNFFD